MTLLLSHGRLIEVIVLETLISYGIGDSNKSVIERLIEYRNKYNYPKAYLVRSDKPTDLSISHGVWASPIFNPQDSSSDLYVDEYHRKLLWSDDPTDNLLGTASVIFWGFYTFGHKYSMNRVRRHLYGYATKAATTPAMIHNVLQNIKTSTDHGNSIGYLSEISQLGRISFASKVVAFIHPETAGVYDKQIDDGLTSLDKTGQRTSLIGSVKNTSVQSGYGEWCENLHAVSRDLNEKIARGEKICWIDPTQGIQNWRTVDVERALFQFFRTMKKKIKTIDGRK